MYVFSKQWFQYYQKTLLFLCNAPIIKYWFRWILRIHRDLSWYEDIYELGPHYYKIKLYGNLLRIDVRTHDKFSKRLYYTFYPLWWMLHQWDLFFDTRVPELSFGFSTLGPIYPQSGSGGANVTCDAYMEGNISPGVWAVLVAQATATYVGNGDTTLQVGFIGSTPTSFTYLMRSCGTWDTSPMGVGAFVQNTVVSVYGTAKQNTGGSLDFHVVSSTQATANVVVTGDFNKGGSTSFGSVIYTSWSTSGYNDVTLSGAGNATVSVSSISKFFFKLNWDVDGVFGGGSGQSYLNFRGADIGGTSNDPKLVSTYYAAIAATFSFDGANANKIMTTDSTMEYSLDGGTSYTTCSTNTDLTSIITSVVFAHGIKIRYIGDTVVQTISIYVLPSAPRIVFPRFGDDKNKLLGSTSLMEYSLNGGSSYTACTTDIQLTLAALSGVSAILVRVKATGYYPSGNVFTIGLEPVMNKLTTPQMVDLVKAFHPQLFRSEA